MYNCQYRLPSVFIQLAILLLCSLSPWAGLQAQYYDDDDDDDDNPTAQYQSESLNDKSSIDKSKWKTLSKEYDYSKERKKKKEKPEEEEAEITEEEKDKKDKMPEGLQNLLKYGLFALVTIVLVFIIIKLVAGNSIFNNKKIEKEPLYTLENIEENLHEVNVEAFLEDALKANNYRLAIRLYYLNILKQLSLSGQIEWKRDKTNGMYLREMYDNPLVGEFRKITYIYEYVWFNDEEVFEAEDFERVRPDFRHLTELVQKTNPIAAKITD